jgi:hypothetical protein
MTEQAPEYEPPPEGELHDEGAGPDPAAEEDTETGGEG